MDNETGIALLAWNTFAATNYPYCALAYHRLLSMDDARESNHIYVDKSWWVNKPVYEVAALSLNPTLQGYGEFYTNMNKILDRIEYDVKQRDTNSTYYHKSFLGGFRVSLRLAQTMLKEPEAYGDKFTNLIKRLDDIQLNKDIPE